MTSFSILDFIQIKTTCVWYDYGRLYHCSRFLSNFWQNTLLTLVNATSKKFPATKRPWIVSPLYNNLYLANIIKFSCWQWRKACSDMCNTRRENMQWSNVLATFCCWIGCNFCKIFLDVKVFLTNWNLLLITTWTVISSLVICMFRWLMKKKNANKLRKDVVTKTLPFLWEVCIYHLSLRYQRETQRSQL